MATRHFLRPNFYGRLEARVQAWLPQGTPSAGLEGQGIAQAHLRTAVPAAVGADRALLVGECRPADLADRLVDVLRISLDGPQVPFQDLGDGVRDGLHQPALGEDRFRAADPLELADDFLDIDAAPERHRDQPAEGLRVGHGCVTALPDRGEDLEGLLVEEGDRHIQVPETRLDFIGYRGKGGGTVLGVELSFG